MGNDGDIAGEVIRLNRPDPHLLGAGAFISVGNHAEFFGVRRIRNTVDPDTCGETRLAHTDGREVGEFAIGLYVTVEAFTRVDMAQNLDAAHDRIVGELRQYEEGGFGGAPDDKRIWIHCSPIRHPQFEVEVGAR